MFQMTVAHVEALRLENHFLRQSLDEKKSDEKEIVEMQKKYHHVIDLTEVRHICHRVTFYLIVRKY